MQDKKLICCGNTDFSQTKEHYICVYCGKTYKKYKIIYQGNDLTEGNNCVSEQRYKGRKIEKLKNNRIGLLYTNKYAVHSLEKDKLIPESVYEVSKSAVEVRKDENYLIENTFREVLIVRNLNTNEIVKKRKCELIGLLNGYVLTLEERHRLCLYHLERCEHKILFDTYQLFGKDTIFQVHNVDISENRKRASLFYVRIGQKDTICGNIMIHLEDEIRYENIIWEKLYNTVTYCYEQNQYYAVRDNKFVEVSVNGAEKKILSAPQFTCILDGGITTPKIFQNECQYAKIMRHNYCFIYDNSIVIIDSANYEPRFCYVNRTHDLIQSFEIIDDEKLCFTAGNKAYIVTLGK